MKALSTFLANLMLAMLIAHPISAADPLSAWGQRTAPGSGYGLNAIAFGNGVFVAVGGNSTILLSADGVNWTNTSPGTYGELRNVHFLNDEFNVVGDTARLLRSTNGLNWTERTLPAGNYLDVAYGNGRYVVAGDNSYASTDSSNWVFASPRAVTDQFLGTSRNVKLECLAFGAGEFVARPRIVDYPTEQGTFHSTDGTNWVLVAGGPYPPTPFTHAPSDIAYANGLFVVASTWLAHIYASSNGVSWIASDLGNFQSPPNGIAYGANYFVAVTSSSTAFFSSTNATSWQQRFQPPTFDTRGVAFGNGTFVVVGASGASPVIYQSGDLGGAPTILAEPVDLVIIFNDAANFSVAASGAPPPTCQWQKDGTPIVGATNTTFTINSVIATDSGGYQVIVANSSGSVTSRVAQLSVSFIQIHEYDGYAGLTILGVPGRTYRIDASPGAGGTWTPITSVVLPQSPYVWFDYDSPSFPTRIYRVVEVH